MMQTFSGSSTTTTSPAPDSSPGNIVEVATAADSFPTLLAAAEAADWWMHYQTMVLR